MQLVDWSGALIGPGSEWFWTMLQFVVVAGTLIGLYRQLRLQSSQEAIGQLGAFDREWRDELYNQVRLEILLSLRSGVDPAHIPEGLAVSIGAFREKIGGLSEPATSTQSCFGTAVAATALSGGRRSRD